MGVVINRLDCWSYLLDFSLEILGSLLKSWPDGSIFSDGSKFSPLELIQKVVVLIKKLLFLLQIAGNSQLYFKEKSFVDLCVDEDISGSSAESIFDPNNLEGIIRIIAHFIQSPEKIYDLAFLWDALAPEKIKYFKVDEIQVVKFLSGLFLEINFSNSNGSLIDSWRNIKQKIYKLVEFTADIGGDCTF